MEGSFELLPKHERGPRPGASRNHKSLENTRPSPRTGLGGRGSYVASDVRRALNGLSRPAKEQSESKAKALGMGRCREHRGTSINCGEAGCQRAGKMALRSSGGGKSHPRGEPGALLLQVWPRPGLPATEQIEPPGSPGRAGGAGRPPSLTLTNTLPDQDSTRSRSHERIKATTLAAGYGCPGPGGLPGESRGTRPTTHTGTFAAGACSNPNRANVRQSPLQGKGGRWSIFDH